MYLNVITMGLGAINSCLDFTTLCLALLNPYHAKSGKKIFFENSIDPDQLASEKPADQDQRCFPLCL